MFSNIQAQNQALNNLQLENQLLAQKIQSLQKESV